MFKGLGATVGFKAALLRETRIVRQRNASSQRFQAQDIPGMPGIYPGHFQDLLKGAVFILQTGIRCFWLPGHTLKTGTGSLPIQGPRCLSTFWGRLPGSGDVFHICPCSLLFGDFSPLVSFPLTVSVGLYTCCTPQRGTGGHAQEAEKWREQEP